MRKVFWLAVSLSLACGSSPVAEIATAKCRGLVLQPNDAGLFPAGALAVADNVVAARDDIVEPRRGLPIIASKALARLFPFKSYLVGWAGGTLCRSSDGVTWTDYAGTYSAPSGAPVRGAIANANLYLTTAAGVQRLEGTAGPVYSAGIPVAGWVTASTAVSAGGVYPAYSQAAYRVVWGRRDANGNLLLGAPSGRTLAVNNTASANVWGFTGMTIPPGVDENYFFQVYRSPIIPYDGVQEPSDEMALVGEYQVPKLTASIATLSRVGSLVSATTTVPHGWATSIVDGGSGATAYINPNNATFQTMQNAAITITGPSSFQYYEDVVGSTTGVVSVAGTIEIVSLGVSDIQPDSMRGPALYTSPSQQGILQGNERLALATDLVQFRGSLLAFGITDWPRIEVDLIGIGAPAGLVANDAITINGTVFTFKASAVGTYDLSLYTSDPLVSVNTAKTARGMVYWLNAIRPRICTARYLSAETDAPGKVLIEALTPSGALTVSVSRPSAWSPKSPQVAPAPPNRIGWSKKFQPDAFPLTNTAPVGTSTDPTSRGVATRDSVFILKGEDGVFRLTGDSPGTFRIDPFDPNTKIVAPETAVATDNKVFALSEQGVVAITDNGVELVSRDIAPALEPYTSGPLAALTAQLAFGIAYESAHKYILFLPTVSTDTACTQAYVYDLLTQAWTRWPVTALHGVVNPVDDKLYLVDGASVRKERKDFAITDYADQSYAVTITATGAKSVTLASVANVLVGDVISQGATWGIVRAINGNVCTLDRSAASFTNAAATSYRAISTVVEWSPAFAPPGMMHEFADASMLFREAYFADAILSFLTDLSGGFQQILLSGPGFGWVAQVDHPVFRATVPRNASRGSYMRVRWEHAQAWTAAKIQALRIGYTPGTTPIVLPRGGTSTGAVLDTGGLLYG